MTKQTITSRARSEVILLHKLDEFTYLAYTGIRFSRSLFARIST
jgi:hypothetical protein